MVDELRLIQVLVQKLHDLIPHFHPHSDIHRARRGFNADLTALLLKPVRPFPSHGGNDLICPVDFSLIRAHPHGPSILHQDLLHHGLEQKLHALLLQVALKLSVNFVSLLGAQMADWTLHQLQVGDNGRPADLPDLRLPVHTVHLRVRPEFQIDPVRFPDQLQRLVIAQDGGQISSHIRGKRQLPVRKSSRPGKARGDGAGITAHALLRLSLGAHPLFYGTPLFYHQHLQIRLFFHQLISAENAARPCADYNHVILISHVIPPF